MRRFILFIVLLLAAWSWFWMEGLDYLPQPRKYITIYGSSDCSRTRSMQAFLNTQTVRYAFKDIKSSSYYKDSMWGELWKKDPQLKVVDTPVVIILDKVLINPSPEKVVKIFGQPVFAWKEIKRQWFNKDKNHQQPYISVRDL